MTNFGEMIAVAVPVLVLIAAIALLIWAYISMRFQRVQLDKIKEINKNIEVFIREESNAIIDNKTFAVVTQILYKPYYKRPVPGKLREIEFIDTIINEFEHFPSTADFTNLRQINALLNHWKIKRDAEHSGKFIDHPVLVFNNEYQERLYWESREIYEKQKQNNKS